MWNILITFVAILCGALASSSTSGAVCKEEWCTSPDGKGGKDCWAGPKAIEGQGAPEPCSCSQGTAELTGDRIRVSEVWYYRYTCCLELGQSSSKSAEGVCGDNTCSEEYCSNDTGEPCWISKSQKCKCSNGHPKIVGGAENVYGGNTYYKYICCTGSAPELSDNEYCASDIRDDSSPRSSGHKRDEEDDMSCSGEYCTSPGAEGGYDCWAGSDREPCTCSKGDAVETGNTAEYEGKTYFEYTCCTGGDEDDYDGEECGDFEGGGGGLAAVLIILFIGCGCGCCFSAIMYFLFKKRVTVNVTDRQVQPPVAAGRVVELSQTGTAPQLSHAHMEKGGGYTSVPVSSMHGDA